MGKPFCSTISGDFLDKDVVNLVEKSKMDYSKDFKIARENFLFERGEVSKRIMETVL